MSETYRPGQPSDEDLECMEDKRLNRLGIDPDGDPIDAMRQVQDRLRELRRLMRDPPPAEDKPEGEEGRE